MGMDLVEAGRFLASGQADPHSETITALCDEVVRLRRIILNTRGIVCNGAESGFDCFVGDWAERLYANNAALTSGLKSPC